MPSKILITIEITDDLIEANRIFRHLGITDDPQASTQRVQTSRVRVDHPAEVETPPEKIQTQPDANTEEIEKEKIPAPPEGLACVKCGRKDFSSLRACGQHKRWCKSALPKVTQIDGAELGTHSECCDAMVAKCRPAHALGNRCCTKCGNMCQWKSDKPLATSWACKVEGCKAQVPGRNGFCFNHTNKAKPEEEKLLGSITSSLGDDD